MYVNNGALLIRDYSHNGGLVLFALPDKYFCLKSNNSLPKTGFSIADVIICPLCFRTAILYSMRSVIKGSIIVSLGSHRPCKNPVNENSRPVFGTDRLDQF